MANAMEILGDDKIILNALCGIPIKHYEKENYYDWFLKEYINNACKAALKYQADVNNKKKEYDKAYKLWIERGGNYLKFREKHDYPYHPISKSQHLIELKVNHYRQKFWYWKKLKE